MFEIEHIYSQSNSKERMIADRIRQECKVSVMMVRLCTSLTTIHPF